jgi:predicted nucleic acid-binding protein
MSKKIIADSGYWIALFNERDEYHEQAQVLEEEMLVHTLLVPWPTLYETINTRLIRRGHDVVRLQKFLEKSSTVLIDDSIYRDSSLESVLDSRNRSYSLADHIIRSMIVDVSISIDAFVGFNPKDFYDVCDSRGIEMVYR